MTKEGDYISPKPYNFKDSKPEYQEKIIFKNNNQLIKNIFNKNHDFPNWPPDNDDDSFLNLPTEKIYSPNLKSNMRYPELANELRDLRNKLDGNQVSQEPIKPKASKEKITRDTETPEQKLARENKELRERAAALEAGQRALEDRNQELEGRIGNLALVPVNNQDLALTLDHYNLFDRAQVFEVSALIDPQSQADILGWGKRLEREYAEGHSGRSRKIILNRAEVSDNIRKAIKDIRVLLGIEKEESQKQGWLSRLFSTLTPSFLKRKSKNRDLVVVDSRTRFERAMDKLDILQSALFEDQDLCVNGLRETDKVKKEIEKYMDSMESHTDALKDIKKITIKQQQESHIGDEAVVRDRIDTRLDALKLSQTAWTIDYGFVIARENHLTQEHGAMEITIKHINQGLRAQIAQLIELENLRTQAQQDKLDDLARRTILVDIEEQLKDITEKLDSQLREIDTLCIGLDEVDTVFLSGKEPQQFITSQKPLLALPAPTPKKG